MLFAILYGLGWLAGGGLVCRYVIADLASITGNVERGDVVGGVLVGMLAGLFWPLIVIGLVLVRLWAPDHLDRLKLQRRTDELHDPEDRIRVKERELGLGH